MFFFLCFLFVSSLCVCVCFFEGGRGGGLGGGGSHNTDYITILGIYIGVPYLGKLPFRLKGTPLD